MEGSEIVSDQISGITKTTGRQSKYLLINRAALFKLLTMYILINKKCEYFAGYDVEDDYEPLTTYDINEAATFNIADVFYTHKCLGFNWNVVIKKITQ